MHDVLTLYYVSAYELHRDEANSKHMQSALNH